MSDAHVFIKHLMNFDLLDDAVLATDNQGHIAFANTTAQILFGLEIGQLIGRHIEDVISPEDASFSTSSIKKLIEEKDSRQGESQSEGIHGDRIWLEWAIKSFEFPEDNSNGAICVLRDITKRKLEEVALKESELNYRSIFNSANDSIIVHEMDTGDILDINEKSCSMFGYSREEMLQLDIGDLSIGGIDLSHEDALRFIENAAEGNPQEFEWLAKKKSGEKIWIEVNLKRIDVGGKPRILAIARDITERKRFEETLTKSEEQYRLLADNATDNIWILRIEDFRFEYISPSVEQILDRTPEEIYEMELSAHMTSESMEKIFTVITEELNREGQDGIAEDRSRTVELEQIRKDGSIIWTEVTARLLRDEQGRPGRILGVTREINERKQVEKELQAEKEISEEIINSLPGLFYMFDESRFVRWNKEWETKAGYPAEELIGLYGTDFFDGADKEIIGDRMRAVFTEGAAETEARFITKDGKRIPHFFTGRRKILDGKPYLIGLGVDITKLKQTEAALRESEERFRYLADAAMEAIFINYNGRCLLANQAAADMFGYDDPSELVGIFGTDVIAPDNHEIANAHMLKNSPEPYEASGLKKDGTIFPVAIRVKTMPYMELGDVRVTSVRDISQRKEQERRFRIIAEASADIIYEWDVATDELLWLGDIDSELGYESGIVPNTIKGWVELIHPEDLKKMEGAVERHRKSKEPINYQYRVLRADGEWRYWQDRAYPILGYDNLPKKWIGACTDVTEQKKLETQLLQAQKMDAIGRLAGGVAHDFNNLLTGITGCSQVIQASLDASNPLYADIEEIRKAAGRAAELTSQLLSFSRKQIVDPKVIGLNEVIEHSKKMLGRIIGEDIHLIFTPSEIPGNINADPAQLDQILVNLAVNARDAMPKGGKLKIETENIVLENERSIIDQEINEHSGEFVRLSVSDSGCGMDEVTKQHIFEPFFTTKKTGEGTGLGLSTVYGIVTQCGGFITVYSEPDVGTTFKMYFPRVAEEAHKQVESLGIEALPRGDETILLVEDEEIVRELTKRILEMHGYKVIEANNGQEALQCCSEYVGNIDLLITDVIMPVMNGRELSEKLQKIKFDLKTIFMSGYTDNVIAHHGVLDAGTQFIPKPFAVETLVLKVREVLDN